MAHQASIKAGEANPLAPGGRFREEPLRLHTAGKPGLRRHAQNRRA